jgi:hypothetical protein
MSSSLHPDCKTQQNKYAKTKQISNHASFQHLFVYTWKSRKSNKSLRIQMKIRGQNILLLRKLLIYSDKNQIKILLLL